MVTLRILPATLIFLAIAGQPCPASDLAVNPSFDSFRKPVHSWKDLRSANVVQQSLDYSCGPAAIATLLSYYYNDHVTEREIIRYLLLTGDVKRIKARKGFSLLDLKNFCRYRGYLVNGFKGDIDFFKALDKPVVVPVNIKDYAHFVVLRGIKDGRVFLADPALGKMTMRVAQFEAIWKEGIGLVVDSPRYSGHGPLGLAEGEEPLTAASTATEGIARADMIGRVKGSGEW